MPEGLSIKPLAWHPHAILTLCQWFETQWPAYYGAGGRGSALQDLQACAQLGDLPIGMVALHAGRACGVAAIKAQSIDSHVHLRPWVAAGLVDPGMRGQGIGGLLLGALEEQARRLGFERVRCGTGTAHGLLQRQGWTMLESVVHDGERPWRLREGALTAATDRVHRSPLRKSASRPTGAHCMGMPADPFKQSASGLRGECAGRFQITPGGLRPNARIRRADRCDTKHIVNGPAHAGCT